MLYQQSRTLGVWKTRNVETAQPNLFSRIDPRAHNYCLSFEMASEPLSSGLVTGDAIIVLSSDSDSDGSGCVSSPRKWMEVDACRV